MTIEHTTITDPYLHEPKGAFAAAANKVYVSNGAGSGTWQKITKSQIDTSAATAGQALIADGAGGSTWKKVQIAQAACLRGVTTGNTTGVTTSYQAMNVANLGGTLAWLTNTNDGMTIDLTAGYIQVPDTGLYHVNFIANIVPASTPSIFNVTIGVDSGAGIVTKEANVLSEIRTTSTVDTNQVSLMCLPSLTANDKVYIMIKETTGGDELELVFCNFILVRVA